MRMSAVTKVLLFSVITGCIIVAPGLVFAIGALVKLSREAQKGVPHIPSEESDPQNVRRSIYRLEKNKYIKIKQISKQKFRFDLTEKGKKLLAQYNFSEFKIKPQKLWDGQWRMFIFDIPEKRKLIRDALRQKLRVLGFFLFQKSVWIFPFECEEETKYICEFLAVQPYTVMFTGKIHNDRLLRKHFIQRGILRKVDLWPSTI